MKSCEPRVLPRPEHPVSRRNVDRNAIKVLYRLHNAGYQAYLVGGGVRDLMLDRRPKDFDVATDARPREIRRLFRNSRLIGRRFRLAHIMFRDSVIEVSTFRRDPDPQEQERREGELLVTSDNTFGTPREDAFRRDFTVNALFYNIADFSVIDYVGGIDDLAQRVIRVIGDPDLRFREDPVRMLRACEFAGRLGFTIDGGTQEAIYRNRREMEKASPARLADELMQLLRCGAAGASLQWALELGLLDVFLPEAAALIEARVRGLGDFPGMLQVIDRRMSSSRPERELSDGAALSALLLSQMELRRLDLELQGRDLPTRGELAGMIKETLAPFFRRFPFPNLKVQSVVDVVDTLLRLRWFPKRRGERAKLASRASFTDALSVFEVLVAATGEESEALARWKSGPRARRRAAKPKPADEGPRRPRRRRRRPRRPPRGDADPGA